jgi:hypothetical protein
LSIDKHSAKLKIQENREAPSRGETTGAGERDLRQAGAGWTRNLINPNPTLGDSWRDYSPAEIDERAREIGYRVREVMDLRERERILFT